MHTTKSIIKKFEENCAPHIAKNGEIGITVTTPLRITIESHRALTAKAHSEGFRRYGQLIRKILHEWALKQNETKNEK